MQSKLRVDELIDVVVVFVRESRKRRKGLSSGDDRMERREWDPSWVSD